MAPMRLNLIGEDGRVAAVLESARSRGVEELALAVGAMPLDDLARQEQIMAASFAQGSPKMSPRLRSVVEAFCAGMPAHESQSFERARSEGSEAMAMLTRLVPSVDNAMECAARVEHAGESELAQAAAYLMSRSRWTLGDLSSEGPCCDVFDLTLSGTSLTLERSGERSLDLRPSFDKARERLNALCWPLFPFGSPGPGEPPCLTFAPKAARCALIAARLCASGWMSDWLERGAPGVAELARSAGVDEQTMAARLWMDAPAPFEAKQGASVAELSHWRFATTGSEARASLDWRGNQVGRSMGLSLGVNAGMRLAMSPQPDVAGLGESTLLGLSKGGAANQVGAAIERVLEVDFAKPRFVDKLQGVLSKIQAEAMADSMPEDSALKGSLKARRSL